MRGRHASANKAERPLAPQRPGRRRVRVPSRPPRRRQNCARPWARRRALAARRRSLHPRRPMSAASPCSSTPRPIARRAGTKAMALYAWMMRRSPSSCRSPSRPTRSSAAGSETIAATCHRRARRQGRAATWPVARASLLPLWEKVADEVGRMRGRAQRRPPGRERRRPRGSLLFPKLCRRQWRAFRAPPLAVEDH